jgi:hypothetical protein
MIMVLGIVGLLISLVLNVVFDYNGKLEDYKYAKQIVKLTNYTAFLSVLAITVSLLIWLWKAMP